MYASSSRQEIYENIIIDTFQNRISKKKPSQVNKVMAKIMIEREIGEKRKKMWLVLLISNKNDKQQNHRSVNKLTINTTQTKRIYIVIITSI